ncbi:hypothetical protein [Acinetobacter ihumii]|uniref:hypothetical protein n=1 Tax=Acinetobacter ihumii TaxID=2483802 RepID=UPI0010302647|nr:hypothetical protein [Acinetobacter ihumii]
MTDLTGNNRREFLALGSALAGVALLSGCNDNSESNEEISVPVNDANLHEQMAAKLGTQLGDSFLAGQLATTLMDVCFSWELPMIAATKINSIVAYAFGNRPNAASGNTPSTGANQSAMPDPGPVNEALADTIYQIYQLKPVKIYAQWEIARFLVAKYNLGSDVLTSIEPIVAPDGSIVYLNTDDVASAIIKLVGGASALGNVAVVGHRDHSKRCILTSKLRGMNASVVQEVALPVIYDPESGQPWTRSRSLYLVHDMYAQMYSQINLLVNQTYPND